MAVVARRHIIPFDGLPLDKMAAYYTACRRIIDRQMGLAMTDSEKAIYTQQIDTMAGLQEDISAPCVFSAASFVYGGLQFVADPSRADDNPLSISSFDFMRAISHIPPDMHISVVSSLDMSHTKLNNTDTAFKYNTLSYINPITALYGTPVPADIHTFYRVETRLLSLSSNIPISVYKAPNLDAFKRRAYYISTFHPTQYRLGFYANAAFTDDTRKLNAIDTPENTSVPVGEARSNIEVTLCMQLNLQLLQYIVRFVTDDAWFLSNDETQYETIVAANVATMLPASLASIAVRRRIMFSFTRESPFILSPPGDQINSRVYSVTSEISTYTLSSTYQVISRILIDHVLSVVSSFERVGIVFTQTLKTAIIRSFSLKQLMTRVVVLWIEMQADPPKGTMPGTMQAKKDRYAMAWQTARAELLKIV